jgi:hypothetical protein
MMKKNKSIEVEVDEDKLALEMSRSHLKYSLGLYNDINNEMIKFTMQENLPANKVLEKTRDFIYNKIDQANTGSGIYQSGVDMVKHPETDKPKGRGYRVLSLSSLRNVQGLNRDNNLTTTTTDNPFFYVTPEDRLRIMQLSTPIQGVITSRMNRIAGLNFNVTSDKKEEDRIYEGLRDMYNLYNEYKGSSFVQYQVAAIKIAMKIKEKLPDILPDLSNFDKSLVRWRKRIRFQKIDKADEIKEWLSKPNPTDTWQDYIKQWVQDVMLHGSVATYKHKNADRIIDSIYILPGGTTFPYREKYISSSCVYFQIISGDQPQIYRPDELSFQQYIPTSMRSYGLIPIEALINKVTEALLFDKLMAEQADGTRFPEKMVIINDASPFGDPDSDLIVPIDGADQKRIEEKFKQKVEGGVMTFTGNNATVVDLTKENTMALQSQRQKDIREDVALVFNMSSMEVNLTGSDSVSGRSTTESQQEIEQGKGIVPIISQIESMFNQEILPFRYDHNYTLEFEISKTEREQLEILRLKMDTGLYSVNEVRQNELNENPFEDDQFDKPPGSQQPDGSQNSPFNFINQE